MFRQVPHSFYIENASHEWPYLCYIGWEGIVKFPVPKFVAKYLSRKFFGGLWGELIPPPRERE